ncbi:uridine kinase [Paractinoplanes abujensis]|uniref:Uridine kinase n=1 Tax=Paractinoplanes abujensis TaxID=882441 RepID=A0A7W7CNI7_9ACTN|nr:uridine kinase [Actinoplanes abujensis]MBB4691828.1 uridine kinase [Actinoplanes abujensis]GID16750.1 uridine kinase [Actinoplanes abujensis]
MAIDGVDGVGKTTFARALARTLRDRGRPVVHISADDFLNPASVRHRRGRRSPEGFWLDSYNYGALLSDVLLPLGPGGDRRFRRAAHDLRTDRALDLPRETAPEDAVLIVDGLFLHRDELRGCWEFTVFLHAPFEVTVARMAARDGSHPDPGHPSQARYVGGQRLYFAACDPMSRADVVIDNTGPETCPDPWAGSVPVVTRPNEQWSATCRGTS